jgi:hypothetical protein
MGVTVMPWTWRKSGGAAPGKLPIYCQSAKQEVIGEASLKQAHPEGLMLVDQLK